MHNFIDLNAVQKLFGVTIALVLIVAGILLAMSFSNGGGQNEPVMCTMEAKLCPDGSTVGRTGPRCEFTPCPPGGQFTREGNIARNNPGFKPDIWYLVYESADAPALTTELLFDAQSECISEGKTISCALTALPQGTRVRVSGVTAGDGILVRTLTQTSGTETGQEIKLYYYNSELDKDASGNIMCSRVGLVPVTRVIPKTNTPIQDVVKLLLRGEISDEERAGGVTSEFPLQGVSLTGASLDNGTLTLTLNDPENRTGGGSCRVGILWFQIEATAKQFPSVTSVRFLPEELFQP